MKVTFSKPIPAKASSSEELFIEQYLNESGISYKREVMVENLKGDHKSYRRADFYLPKFNVYIEYFGLYNATRNIRQEYDKKAEIYLKNSIPTIFLYPHKLGFLDYAFHIKMLRLMEIKKFKSNFKIFHYKTVRWWYYGRGYLFFITLVSGYLFLLFLFKQTGLTQDMNDYLFALFFAITIVSFGHFLLDLYRHYIKNY
ncbi:hypothetical protein [Christiangramia sp. LLG6405-1]|uniref:hypothetical protein n=1 Tax=Christiangramia sp. LLG6405-1 TaxID=3160832 RepID=UPI00386D31D2